MKRAIPEFSSNDTTKRGATNRKITQKKGKIRETQKQIHRHTKKSQSVPETGTDTDIVTDTWTKCYTLLVLIS